MSRICHAQIKTAPRSGLQLDDGGEDGHADRDNAAQADRQLEGLVLKRQFQIRLGDQLRHDELPSGFGMGLRLFDRYTSSPQVFGIPQRAKGVGYALRRHASSSRATREACRADLL